jgi:hypothetical protein
MARQINEILMWQSYLLIGYKIGSFSVKIHNLLFSETLGGIMSFTDRIKLIEELEKVRDSRVLCYILGDRESFPPGFPPGYSLQLSNEPAFQLQELVRSIGKIKKLDLFLYTRGGSTDAVWPLINLLREYCEHLTVIVPFRAHSAGTLICLGADEIIMTEAAELSPIDPTTGNQFNPSDPANPQSKFGISVEDVAAYFELSAKRADIAAENLKLEVFKELTNKVHPLALGNVQRVYNQIRFLARNLLSLHLDVNGHKERIDSIIKSLTEEFYSHVHSINRKEAASLMGDWVRLPNKEEETLIANLFGQYVSDLELNTKFQTPEYMGDNPECALNVIGGFLETKEKSYKYETSMNIFQRSILPQGFQVQVPPGSIMPLLPGFPRSFDSSILHMAWMPNE